MRIAIIDLGTNSVRFDIHQVETRGIRTLHREKLMVRLGQGVFLNGQLDPNAIQRTVQAFATFKKISDDMHVHRIMAIATSALREASDSKQLITAIKKLTGIEIRVISGVEEARLISTGVIANENLGKGTYGLIDIGGGSTEISVCKNRKVLHCESFPLGTARLQQVFLKKSPPKEEDIDHLRRYIRNTVYPKIYEQKWPRVDALVGSSGTVKALTRMIKKTTGSKALQLKKLSHLIQTMSTMTTTQLLGIPGMESKRVDMILAGSILLEELMIALRGDKISPTDFSLRDGILEEQLELVSKHVTSTISFHLPDLFSKAKKLGGNEEHLIRTAAIAETIFKRLKPIHKLKDDWCIYLTAAAILRNIGESVSHIGHEEHSYYIVKNANFPSVEPWESEFIAQLCRYHNRCKSSFETIKFPAKHKEDKKRKQAFLKLLALLCVVDSLDLGAKTPVSVGKIQILKKKVIISLKGASTAAISYHDSEHRKCLFERIFKRPFQITK